MTEQNERREIVTPEMRAEIYTEVFRLVSEIFDGECLSRPKYSTTEIVASPRPTENNTKGKRNGV